MSSCSGATRRVGRGSRWECSFSPPSSSQRSDSQHWAHFKDGNLCITAVWGDCERVPWVHSGENNAVMIMIKSTHRSCVEKCTRRQRSVVFTQVCGRTWREERRGGRARSLVASVGGAVETPIRWSRGSFPESTHLALCKLSVLIRCNLFLHAWC